MSWSTILLIVVCGFAFAGIGILAMSLIMMERPQALPGTPGAPAPGPAPTIVIVALWRNKWVRIPFWGLVVLATVTLIYLFGLPLLHPLPEPYLPPEAKTGLYTAFNPMYLVLIVLITATLIALLKQNWPLVGVLVAVALAVYAITYYYGPAPTCAPDDLACIRAQQEAAAAVEVQKRVAAAAKHLEQVVQEHGQPAQTDECPGTSPTEPHLINTDLSDPDSWEEINPHHCDFTYTLARGRMGMLNKDHRPLQPGEIARYVRALDPDTAIYYMLCPASTGPAPGTMWQCRRVKENAPQNYAGVRLTLGVGIEN